MGLGLGVRVGVRVRVMVRVRVKVIGFERDRLDLGVESVLGVITR